MLVSANVTANILRFLSVVGVSTFLSRRRAKECSARAKVRNYLRLPNEILYWSGPAIRVDNLANENTVMKDFNFDGIKDL